ncbi:uncharacterized protein LOC117329298 [Pecten maximus]|uniref:uncharacterized protein LOC117329298 n=1 Tax=Pecten maximus TaxID=6579 RepID=UPI001458F370|nr:uncharacterized protein LOC117329298 [Pecten maximus]
MDQMEAFPQPALTPPIAADYCCGRKSAHLATIHSQEDNDFLMLLGIARSTRWIGYHYHKSETRWVDNSTIDFINFGYTNTNLTNDYCTYTDEVGYWRQSACLNFEVKDVACERSARCKPLPVVVNGSYSSSLVADIGTTYVYSCNPGYILADSHSGAVTCLEVGRESLWTVPPICTSLLGSNFEVYIGPTLYGLQLNSAVKSYDALCAVDCYNNADCSVFVFNPTSLECITCSNKSESSQSGLVSLPSYEIWTRIYNYCGPVPHVEHASYNVTGTGPGSKVQYQCQGHYRIDRMTPGTLTCNNQALWDQHQLPVCVSRFERTKIFSSGYRSGKAVYKLYSIVECELACMEETQFRCVRCSYYPGVCYLFDKPHLGNRGDYINLDRNGFVSSSESSELIDADLEEFDLWYHQTVEIQDGELLLATDGQSAELCAQTCIYHNCSFFSYHWLNLTCAVFGGGPPVVTPVPSDSDSQLYIRRYGCAAPPTVASARVEMVLQQVQGSYSIGDRAQVECLISGEERVNNHDGEIVCQKTGQWSIPPACRNLCPDGWYMKEYICYKLYDGVVTFWEAYDACHLEDAGLVNIQTVTELESSIVDVWNWTNAVPASYWLGAYTDVGTWKWSERLAGDILSVLPSLSTPTHSDRLGVAVDIPGGAVNEVPVTDAKPFICEKAAAKLVCPTGWEKYQSHCLKVFYDMAMNYTDAISSCQTEGATLASVPAVFAADVIGDLVTAAGEIKAYIGLHKPITGMYKFEDGTQLLHKYLMTQESSNDHLYEKCGTLEQDYLFGTTPCTDLLAYVCQKPLDEFGIPTDFSNLPCSTDYYCNDTNLVCSQWKDKSTFLPPRCVGIDCPQPWVYINGRCYLYSHELLTFEDAFVSCVEADSEVFVPNTVKENYDIFFWLRSLQNHPTTVHIGIEKLMGPTHISMDTRKTPSFIRSVTSSTSYCLGVSNTDQGTWKGVAGDVTIGKVCERGPKPKQPYDYLYEGCYTEVVSEEHRDLSERTLLDTAMTVDLCATHCKGHGFKYCGIEAGNTCRCGNTRGRHGRLATTSCSSPCPGNNTQICGGNNVIAVYRVTGN